ncbi:MAG: histidine--tRNA ligase [Candidatus Neomarinimicrobiota bacterium]|nr:histidine--tRNA ligase [Candidatus Neomarinimicrobiota bacterium]
MSHIRTIKGTHDILPAESKKWQRLERIVHTVCRQFGYEEIRTPIFEETRLFLRSIGEDSDIVSKEMYSWSDKDGTGLTLRPELTAPVVRSFIQHNLGTQSPIQRLYYLGPSFRRERPQKGRTRQFHQFGVEAFGSSHPEQDAEIIALAWHILSKCGLSHGVTLHLNSIGSPECRSAYRDALKEFIRPNLDQFSEISQRRFKSNPLRILDTKSENEKKVLNDVPSITQFLSADDRIHFDMLQDLLKTLNISVIINPKLVRGLDYYSQTVFEFTSDALGAQDALLGGGRYDGLVKNLGGKATPGIGFAAGMERFLIAMESLGEPHKELGNDIYFVCLDKEGIPTTLTLSNELRQAGFNVVSDPLRRSMKAQMRDANKSNARFVLILGQTELESESVILKNLVDGEQDTVSQSEIIKKLRNLTN